MREMRQAGFNQSTILLERGGMTGQYVKSHVERIFSCVSGNRKLGGVKVESLIAASWERSLECYGIDPSLDRQIRVLTGRELRESAQSAERFMHIAKTGARHLYGRVKELGYITMLSDFNGVIFDINGINPREREYRRTGLACLGAVWDEQYEGTNASGLAIAEKRPVTVHKGEHFRYRYANLTCSAAPIIGPDGKTLGAMDISALCSPDSKSSQHFALAAGYANGPHDRKRLFS